LFRNRVPVPVGARYTDLKVTVMGLDVVKHIPFLNLFGVRSSRIPRTEYIELE
jgi:hypothetical protein